MAEQNRKTTEQRLWRIEAEKVVDAFLDYLFADSDHESIILEGRSLLGIYSEHGEIPRGSGFTGFCKMAGKVDRMRLKNVTERMLWARRQIIHLEDNYIGALCVDRCYRGRTKASTDPFTQERVETVWDDRRCASLLRISPEAMRKRISRGYQMLEAVLQSNNKVA